MDILFTDYFFSAYVSCGLIETVNVKIAEHIGRTNTSHLHELIEYVVPDFVVYYFDDHIHCKQTFLHPREMTEYVFLDYSLV